MSEGLTINQLAERNALLVTENADLQKKLDAAEARECHLSGEMLQLAGMLNRANAEIEKQEPVGWMTQVEVDELHRGIAEEAYIYKSADATSIIPLFTRPAPAINFAELVLDENDNPQGFIDWYEHHFATQPYKGASHVTDCENAWRAAILRNIEEK